MEAADSEKEAVQETEQAARADGVRSRPLAPEEPVTALSGVGPATAEKLRAGAGIHSLGDLLRFFPRRHDELAVVGPRDVLSDGADGPVDGDGAPLDGRPVRVEGRIERARAVRLRGGRSFTEVHVRAAGTRSVAMRFFNQPWLARSLAVGDERSFEGILEVSRAARGGSYRLELAKPRVLGIGDPLRDRPCTVRYPTIPGISEARLRVLIGRALERCDLEAVAAADLPPLPPALRGTRGVLDGAAAVRAMHVPEHVEEHEGARWTFAVQEAVAVFRRLERVRRRRRAMPAVRIPAREGLDLESLLGHPPTPGQACAIAEVAARMDAERPMAVLLQGDVGTGKTVVALDAVVRAVRAGAQAVFLAPTTVLAEQQHDRLRQSLGSLGIRCVLWTGGLDARTRRNRREEVRAGRADVVVGTHALASDDLVFCRLGLVVIDEQHRFGVAVRAGVARRAGEGGTRPHVLVMTATPIPRTTAMVRFGDLDVLELRDRPQVRPPAPAVFVPREGWHRIHRVLARHVRRGGRVFVVCPKIGERGEPGGVVRVAEDLENAGFRVARLHGQMPAAERQALLAGLRSGEVADVLVTTTVVEVGIDVPEATLVVVVGADAFGTATLHQLRGRVARGGRRGLCILTAAGEPGPRVRVVCSTTDGFEIAEADLLLRGGGELLGVRQSGAGELRALDPVADCALLDAVREAVASEAGRRDDGRDGRPDDE